MNNNHKRKESSFQLAPTCVAVLLAFGAQTAQANPVGAAVVSGQASFASTANTLTVANTPGTIINWQGFSIQQNEITRFAQQSASSTVLNRVVSNNPSQILGTLQSNGRVFLVNPNGIIFGAGSTVDVAGLVATTLNLSNADFLAGRHNYTQVPGAANISNAGNIAAQSGGEIYLIAPNVENTGIITAPNGDILLAAGYEVQLVNSLDPNLRVNITAPAGDATNVGQLVASAGQLGLFGTIVKNSGTVSADSATLQGGKIVFKASQRVEAGGTISVNGTSGGIVDISVAHSLDPNAPGVVIHTGDIQAQGVAGAGGVVALSGDSILSTAAINTDGITAGGQISLQASNRAISTSSAQYTANSTQGQGGDILVSADVSNYTSGSYSATGVTGGNLTLAGNEIKLAGAQLDASGSNGGGSIHVGGLMHGATGFSAQGIILANATHVFTNNLTSFKADAFQTGNGGEVVLWSDQSMRFSGDISAQGGALSGNGGNVEVSGLTSLAYNGLTNLSAANGLNGNLLLDPRNITIVAGNGALAGAPYQEILDPTPGGAEGFGGFQNLVLANGNILIASPLDSAFGLDSGAVYLYTSTGTLVSTLVGSSPGDKVGGVTNTCWNGPCDSGGFTELANGNVIVTSNNWNGTRGAVTWMSATGALADGSFGGAVSASNSLVGGAAGDAVGSGGITVLTDNSTFWNVAVRSDQWGGAGVAGAGLGAVTWMSGTTGKLSTAATGGAVSSLNSLVGSIAGDKVGANTFTYYYGGAYDQSGLSALGNGNLLIASNNWSGTFGAVTWMNGATGALSDGLGGGAVSSSNSLVGSTAGDKVGGSNTILANGNVLVVTSGWTQPAGAGPALANVGAVTWMNGATGKLSDGISTGGAIAAANSLVGSQAGDKIGANTFFNAGTYDWSGLTVLGNGNLVIASNNWSGTFGAVTWMNGATGLLSDGSIGGAVTAANSLVGSVVGDRVGNERALLANGNVVMSTSLWNGSRGAMTWMNGATGQLSDGSTGGAVSTLNSLVGSTAGDKVGTSTTTWFSDYNGWTLLGNGNLLIASNNWNNGGVAAGAGAVSWMNGATGRLSDGSTGGAVSSLNSLLGSTAGDKVGSTITTLANNNAVVITLNWTQPAGAGPALASAGAVTWMDGVSGKLSDLSSGGAISSANSLLGGAAYDRIGSSGISQVSDASMTFLNYLVSSPEWGSAGVASAGLGAVTWMSGTTGKLSTLAAGGTVSAANSLVGSTAGDRVSLGSLGYGFWLLSNGNVLVRSAYWSNGVGALTWMNGATGALSDATLGGAISASNSLMGGTVGDNVGSAGITELGNGKLVIASPYWNNGAATRAGAVTWMDSANGKLSDNSTGGLVTATNSLVGSAANDTVGSDGVTQVTDNLGFWNYVVRSSAWSGTAGAITWVNGNTGKTFDGMGTISSANSLVGSAVGDYVGSGWNSVLALGNGKAVFASSSWNGGRGAVSWMDGATGKLADGTQGGFVSATNSLVGSTATLSVAPYTPGDQLGSGGLTEITDYSTFWNYAVLSPNWTNGAAAGAGAVTFGNGATGTVGVVSGSNSLVGSATGDRVGSGGITLVSDGTFWNFVVSSPDWGGAGGYLTGKGAVTWVNGMTGKLSNGAAGGAVAAGNSLTGSAAGDQVGVAPGPSWSSTLTCINVFSNGNMLIRSQHWGGEFSALTWMSGSTGALADGAMGGAVSPTNSLLGSAAYDDLGGGVVGLTELLMNGNWVITSPGWGSGGNNWSGGIGAATWMNSSTGQLADGSFGGVVSASNSLVGSVVGDIVGGDYACDCSYTGGVTALSDGNYVVNSLWWGTPDIGAVTWGNGTGGTVGIVSGSNSVFALVNNVIELASQPGKVLIGSGTATANGGAGGVYLLSEQPSGPLFADNPSLDTFIGARWIAATLNTGTNVTLQANNDITQATGAAITATGSGNLTLQAGRSVILGDVINITGALNLIANDPGAIAVNRGTGAAVIDTTLATLTASQITRTNFGSATPSVTLPVTLPVAPTVSETGLQLEKMVNTIAMLPGTFIDIKPLVAPVVMNVTPLDTTSERKKEAETAAAATAEAAALIATEAPVPQPMLQCK